MVFFDSVSSFDYFMLATNISLSLIVAAVSWMSDPFTLKWVLPYYYKMTEKQAL